jgi:hypothetical protein
MRIQSFYSQQTFTQRMPPDQNRRPLAPSIQSKPDEHQADTVKLKSRDQEVRRHEQAHLSAAGGLASGGANFSYQTGPDGKRYAVGGEVNIDTSPVPGDPHATLRKAQQIRRAALAPADPSPQDRAVAASASAMEISARQDLKEKDTEGSPEKASPPTPRIDLFV